MWLLIFQVEERERERDAPQVSYQQLTTTANNSSKGSFYWSKKLLQHFGRKLK